MSLRVRPSEAPAAMPGFEHIKRYWDAKAGIWVARIAPGEFYITRLDEMISTVLGSCVAACIRDVERNIGGMNHFLLPAEVDTDALVSQATSYGTFAMESLINELLKNGARRPFMEAKVFGGGRMISGMSDVGARNVDFVLDYLQTEGIRIASRDLGGDGARALQYFPLTGRARMKRINRVQEQAVVAEEKKFKSEVEVAPVAGEIDLF